MAATEAQRSEMTAMQVETVEIRSQQMLYVTRSSSMASEEIAEVMQEAFGAIGAFRAC